MVLQEFSRQFYEIFLKIIKKFQLPFCNMIPNLLSYWHSQVLSSNWDKRSQRSCHLDIWTLFFTMGPIVIYHITFCKKTFNTQNFLTAL